MGRFIEEQQFAFKLVLMLYAEHLTVRLRLSDETLFEEIYTADDTKRFRIAVEGRIKIYLENYCRLYLQQLIEFNSNGKYANSMTERLFRTQLDLAQFPPALQAATRGETNFFKLLFNFIEFAKTPEKVCELCITLFQLPGFR
jgi:hypothetical protein